jgi:hypothetical protein
VAKPGDEDRMPWPRSPPLLGTFTLNMVISEKDAHEENDTALVWGG